MCAKKKSSPKNDKDFVYEYDPVKHEIGGQEAEKVIWTTAALNKAVKAINEGLPLKANPFCGKNTKLLRPDLVYRRTEEEIEDYMKCMKDPVYFGEKCYLMTPEGLQQCKLRDYQVKYLRHLLTNRFSIYLACRQCGKSVVTGIYGLWKTLFTNDNNGLVLSKSGAAGKDLIKKIKDMYLHLPYHLKAGTMKWNSSEISFDNNSSIHTESFSDTAGLGSTINTLILDEFAWCPANEVDLFYENIIPTVTTISNSNVCIMSTQNGFNKFYEIWNNAITKKNIYAPFKTDWYDVPQYNSQTKQWDKRDEAWKEMMTGVLGSEEAFYYQYGTQFSASDKCLVSRECIGKMRDLVRLYEKKEMDWLFLQYKDCLLWDPEFDLEDLKTKHFFILVDLAEGGGGDYTVFQIFRIDAENLYTQVGTWTSNKVDLEKAALEFWLLAGQLFNNDRCLFSLEWNTYGALFYKLIIDLNEPDYDNETIWRFNCNVDSDGLDQTRFVNYKKTSIEEEIGAIQKKKRTTNFVPGIRFTGGNKSTACSLLKILLEKGQIIITSLSTLSELENFEDKNGNGTYKASFGHDDLIMCCAQIPMMQQTPIWKEFIDDFKVYNLEKSLEDKHVDNTSSLYGSIGGLDRSTELFTPPTEITNGFNFLH